MKMSTNIITISVYVAFYNGFVIHVYTFTHIFGKHSYPNVTTTSSSFFFRKSNVIPVRSKKISLYGINISVVLSLIEALFILPDNN